VISTRFCDKIIQVSSDFDYVSGGVFCDGWYVAAVAAAVVVVEEVAFMIMNH
jgi:hypothetical protein